MAMREKILSESKFESKQVQNQNGGEKHSHDSDNKSTGVSTKASKIAIVTGASAGIGEETAYSLAEDGWNLFLIARRAERLESVCAECYRRAPEGSFHVISADISQEEDLDLLEETLKKQCADMGVQGIDLLVNNAGGARGLDPVLEANREDWRWMYEVNVLGTLEMTKRFYPLLLKGEAPQIINVVSIAGRGAYRGGAGYNAAKFGETALTDVMRMEFADDGVRVCQVDPGRVATEFSLNRFKGDHTRATAVYEGNINLIAEDIAEAIAWIASRPARVDIESIMIKPVDQV